MKKFTAGVLVLILAAGQSKAGVPCPDLQADVLEDATFDEPPVLIGAGVASSGTTSLPAHCLIRGTLESRVDAAGRPFGSKFELRMPQEWKGRFMFQGGGGTDGAVLPAFGDRNQPAGNVPALAQGFAVVTTDGGHEDADASFGLDGKARTDWGYHSALIVTRAAKRLVDQFYGRPPDFSYLVGCSNGGRQGMMMSQRFPDEYNGIVAGDPVFRLSVSHIASAWDIQTFTAIAPDGPDGKPVLARAFSDLDLRLLSAALLDRCDGNDGLRDGLVSDTRACDFDPASLQCKGAKTDDCLSPAQVGAMRRYIAGPTDSRGRPLYAAWPWDPSFASPGWRAWKLGTSSTAVPNAIKAGLSNNAIRYVFLTPPDPQMTEEKFDFDRDPARMSPAAAFADATSPDLSKFRARGGKILFYHGMGDPAISARDTQSYYETLVENQGGLGSAQDFARLFLVPGMNHCSGGNGLDSFDSTSAIVEWVERGKAPSRITARARAVPGMTRPLCPFPSISRYIGGNADEERSFTCEY